jgi:enolase-phosphatase E1
MPPAAVLLDIEGTTSRIAFVRDTLFPYARARLPALLAERADDPEVAAELAAIARRAPGEDPLSVLLGWMDQDAKETPLKELQGLLWREGYASGELRGDLYPDVAPELRRWAAAGIRLYVYSSGSVAAQKLIFGHSVAGDLTPLLSGFFDTRIGPKRAPASYQAIAQSIGLPPARLLFLSDVAEELDAARTSGLQTCQLVRPEDATIPSGRHPVARDFSNLIG